MKMILKVAMVILKIDKNNDKKNEKNNGIEDSNKNDKYYDDSNNNDVFRSFSEITAKKSDFSFKIDSQDAVYED